VTTNDVSPYLQRPVRTLEEVMAEAEQQRLEQAASVTPPAAAAVPSKSGEAPIPSSSLP
jgi:hypothetical protein